MKTKILYVIVSTENDIYLEQAFVSIASVKYHMPNAHIVVIMDQTTNQSLNAQRSSMLKDVNELIIVKLDPTLSGQQRSRLLKTSFRNHIGGDLLFIDCDTIIERNLEEIDDISADLAACRDSHSSLSNNPYRKMCLNHCHKIGIDISNENEYFNSGVILARDTQEVRDFFIKWNENWKAGKENGIFMDQPSFAKTNIQFNHIIKPLPDKWNCQIIHGVKYIPQANILHYLCTSPTKGDNEEVFILRDKNKLLEVKKTGKISPEISDCFSNPFNGIPDLVHVLAGNNVKLIQSDTFRLMERIFGGKAFNFLNMLARNISLLQKLPKFILSKLKKR